MDLRLACAAALGVAAFAPAQSTRMTAVVDRNWFVEVDHGILGQLERSELPAGTDFAGTNVRNVQAATGRCTAMSTLVVNGNPSSLLVQATVSCSLLTGHSGASAMGRSGGDLLVTLTSPQPTEGTLFIGIDTRNSFGPTTLGEMFVDIGDDGVGEYGHGGQNPSYVSREFPCASTPEGTRVRITHLGYVFADSENEANYYVNLTLRYMPQTNPIVPYLDGCHPLRYGRTMSGVTFDFGTSAIPPGTLYFLAIGTPSPVPPMHLLERLTTCGPVLNIDAVQMLATPRLWLPRPFLRSPDPVVIQGFVFGPAGVLGTDSWRLF